MALTITQPDDLPKGRYSVGPTKAEVRFVEFDNSYPTGGEALGKDTFGFHNDPVMVLATPTSGFVFEYDYTNEKLKAFFADYDAAADGALIEVPNTSALLDGIVVRVLAIGV